MCLLAVQYNSVSMARAVLFLAVSLALISSGLAVVSNTILFHFACLLTHYIANLQVGPPGDPGDEPNTVGPVRQC